MNPKNCLFKQTMFIFALLFVFSGYVCAADLTFFGFSDTHYTTTSGENPMVSVINNLPGTAYPASIGGTVGTPRGILMPGDLINAGGDIGTQAAQWANYIADFGVNGEGRCLFPVFEGLGNHDTSSNWYVFNQIKDRTLVRQGLGWITNISANGYHYSWDWDGVHFIVLNIFPGNIWYGEADTYSYPGHDPKYARDFLISDLQANVGNTGRPVVVIHHFRPVDENWWTFAAIDKYFKELQDYNIICIVVGHQGGGVNNTVRGINWVSCNGVFNVFWISPANNFYAVQRTSTAWGTPFQKNIFWSFATSGLAAWITNGDYVSNITSTTATLSGKLVYEAASPTNVTFYWGTTDGGTTVGNWQHSQDIGVQTAGSVFTADIDGLVPFTTYYYRCKATNSSGTAWSKYSYPFTSAGTMPDGWATSFVGYEQRPGGAHCPSYTFTVKGSGRDIGEGSMGGDPAIDNFQYAYKTLNGDGEIKARIASLTVTTRNPKVGVMLRESLDASSKSAAVLLSTTDGTRFFARSATGGSTNISSTNSTKAAPLWVKVVRSGNTFSGYMSSDGIAWTQLGSNVTISMSSQIYAGLADTAGNRDGSGLQTATFDNVLPITDFNAPTPNPATFAVPPVGLTQTSITMTATTGADISLPIMYYFDETSGNPGGTDSGWQAGTTYIDTDLEPDLEYTYTVQMRDSLGNVGTASAPESATTLRACDFNMDGVVDFDDVKIFVQDWLLEYTPFDPGPVGQWNFDETSGTTAYDSIGSNDAALNGGATLNGSGFLALDGSNDYAIINRTISNDFTIALFLKTTHTGGTANWYNGDGIVDGEVGGVANDFGTALVGAKFGFGVGNPDTTITSNTSINNGAWHHVAATRNATTGVMKVYVDGVLEKTATGPTGARSAPSKLRIGCLQTNINFFPGSIDRLDIFDYVLPDDKIAELAAGALPGGQRPTNMFIDEIINFKDFAVFADCWLE